MEEFNLSEKRKAMEGRDPRYNADYLAGWEDALKECNEQDKEFIKKLKEDFDESLKLGRLVTYWDFEAMLKKRAGDDLK